MKYTLTLTLGLTVTFCTNQENSDVMKYTLNLTLGLIVTFWTNQENSAVMKYTLTLTLGLILTFCTNQEKCGCNEIHTNPNLNPRFDPNFLHKSRKMRV